MFSGVGTALVTPFDRDLNIDYDALNKIVDQQIAANVDALIVLGTTGESPVISIEERKKLIAAVSERAAGKAKIIVGTGSNDTKKVVELNRIAEELKVDGLLIVNPYYNKGSQESLVHHYKYIAERTSLPIIIYNVPSRTGMNILPETIIKIHKACPNIAGVKEASGNISQIAHLISIKDDPLTVLSGNDDQTLPIMALGGKGVISVFSNPYPAQMKQVTDAVLNGELRKAQDYNNKYLSMMNNLFVEISPAPVKFVMHRLGLCENTLRLPLIPVAQKSEQLLINEMKKLS